MVDNDVEKRLWAAADQLWANTGLRPSDFSAPVLGLIFLRYACSRCAPPGHSCVRQIRLTLSENASVPVIYLAPADSFDELAYQ